MTEPPSRSRLHFKFAALGAIGTALVLVPLTEVLQLQGQAVQAARDERAALDPMATAVALQRALLAHRELASHVLRGLAGWEPPRLQGAARVDQQLNALTQALRSLALQQPLEESQALAEDWWQLARAVGGRSISPAASDLSHRLRVEQSLQVMDLLSAPWGVGLDTGTAELRHAAVALPRLSAQWALVAATDTADAAETAQRALRQQARLLAAVVGATQGPATAGAPQGADLAARAGAALQATQRLLALGHGAGSQQARVAALQAVTAVHDAVWQQHLQAVDARIARHQRARTFTLASMGTLLLAGLWLLVATRRPPVQPAPEPDPLLAKVTSGAESSPEAGRLLQRLRASQALLDRHRGTPAQDAQPTQPPP